MSDVFTQGFPDEVDAAAVESAREVVENAPDAEETYALVSGGHDSHTAAHIVYQAEPIELDGFIHVNTGIGVPETREFVRQRAADLDVEYHEVGSEADDPGYVREYRRAWEEYVYLVEEYGFPGPPVHKWMYANLKEKPLQRFLSQELGDDVLLVSGVSQYESENRMENVDADGQQEFLGCPTISPLVDATALDVRRYRRGLDLPMNPVVDNLEMSGECLCGAFSDRGELRMIRLFYPDVYRYIKALEARVGAAACLDDGPPEKFARWGHNRLDDHEREAMDDGDQMLLCQSCEMATDGGECSR